MQNLANQLLSVIIHQSLSVVIIICGTGRLETEVKESWYGLTSAMEFSLNNDLINLVN